MANRIESALSGIGTLAQVAAEHVRLPDVSNSVRLALSGLCASIDNLQRESGTQQVVAACACAILNCQFEKSGYLLTANGSGKLNVTFVACDSDRKVILNLMAD